MNYLKIIFITFLAFMFVACGNKDAQDAVLTYTLNYTANANGSITGTSVQTINQGQDATAVTAIANAGYHFTNWSDASTQNPRIDSNIQANLNISANFAQDGYAQLGAYTPLRYSNNLPGNEKYIIYYPENGITADMPVVMFIKGGGPSTIIENYSGIMQFLASKGYYVIGVDASSYESWFITEKLEIALNRSIASHGLSVSKLAILGHSLGGGQTFYAMKKFRDDGYGNSVSLALSIDGWFAFNMNEVDLNNLNTKVSFLQMNGVLGTGTDPRIHLKIWDLSTQADRSFYTLASTNHSYVKGDLANVLDKQDLLFSIGALVDDTFKGVDDGANAIPQTNKATYHDVLNALEAKSTYNSGDCAGIQFNAINVIQHNDIDYCRLDHLTNIGEDFIHIATYDMAKPDYNTSYVEENFASKVTRITDRSVQSGNFHPYPKQGNAWNSDMSIISMGYRLYDAESFQELAVTYGLTGSQAYAKVGSPYHGPADIRWSKSNPNLMYVLDSHKRYKKVMINPQRTDTNTSVLIDFTPKNYSNITTGNNEGNLDHNDEYIVFAAQTDEDNRSVTVILYKLGEADVRWTKTSSQGLWREKSDGNSSTSEAPMTFDWVSVDPTATYIVIAATNESDTNGKRYVYDMNLGNERILSDTGAHGDMGIDMHGNPVYVQFQFFGEQGIWSHNLVTLEANKLLPSKYNGGHISCRNVKRLGWCYVNTSQEGYREVFALKLDAGTRQVQRFAQTHISQQNRGCAQVSVSPDGTKVLFSSDWNEGSADDYLWDRSNWKSCTDDTRRIKLDTYQVEF